MKTNIFSTLRNIFNTAQYEGKYLKNIDSPKRTGENFNDRRKFLKNIGQAGLLLSVQSPIQFINPVLSDKHGPKIAIVGAGMGGLTTAYYLRRKGVLAAVFEADTRAGGRIKSGNQFGNGLLTTEIGAEFIDTAHADMLWFAKAFGFMDNIIDVERDTFGVREVFSIEGKTYTLADIITELNPVYTVIDQDIRRGNSKKGDLLDNTSLADYIETISVSKWMKQLLHAAFIGENGLETAEQSALNFLQVFGTTPNKFKPFGDSDERYKIRGGNEQIPKKLAEMLGDQIQYEHRLLAIKEMENKQIKLVFSNQGTTIEQVFDAVVLTIPFSILRDIEIDAPLSPLKRKVIDNLGYGTNTKFILETTERPWRQHKSRGFLFNDVVHNGWDSSQDQLNNKGIGTYTVYWGGNLGKQAIRGTEQDQKQRITPALNGIFPSFSDTLTNNMTLAHWTSNPNIKGSYSCFKPGQVLEFEGVAAKREGRIYFAGEHCSTEYWGFMNGAAQTGRQAAEALLKKIRR